MKLHPIIILLSVVLLTSKAEAQALGEKIGYVEGHAVVFATDTISLKQSLEGIINKEDIKLDKIEIRQDITFGERQEVYYMLIAYDYSKALKIARWLVNREGGLYYHKMDSDKDPTPNDLFYSTYFTCHGTNTDCFPMVAYIGRYGWTGSRDLMCKPDSDCVGIKTVVFDE